LLIIIVTVTLEFLSAIFSCLIFVTFHYYLSSWSYPASSYDT
jgi:hypothetical protein